MIYLKDTSKIMVKRSMSKMVNYKVCSKEIAKRVTKCFQCGKD